MDGRIPSLCPACDGMVINPLSRTLAPLAVGIALLAMAALVAPYSRAFALVCTPLGLAAMTLGRSVWARPTASTPVPAPCKECGREDVGYINPGDSVCAVCTERLELKRVFAEQAELERQPGYRITDSVAREKARLQKGMRQLERPNGEL